MRRVWTTSGMLPLVLLAAASLLFLGSGVHEAKASSFQPQLTVGLTNPAAGAVSNINESASWGTAPTDGNRAFPASSVYFTPASWGIPNCAGANLSSLGTCPYAFGERTGEFTSTTTFGLLNSQCAIAVPVEFPNGMKNASTDPGDSIAPGAAFANLSGDTNPADGVQDGAQHWNTLLGGLQAAGLLPPTPPRERQILHTNALGTEVWVDVVTYDPGLLGGPATAPLGYATTFILQNANPLNPPTPGLITDTCGLSNSFTQAGLASGGNVHRTNPATPGTKVYFVNSGSARDADQGPSAPEEPTIFVLAGGLSGHGLVNNLDTCPFTPNHGSPLAPAGPPFNGDQGESPGDGIDAACDPNAGAPESGAQCNNADDDDADTLVNDGCPAVGDPETQCAGADDDDGDGAVNDGCPSGSAAPVFNGSDIDLDAYLNRGDNCPLVANGAGFGAGANNQQDLGEVSTGVPADGGPASDGIGDDCDIHPTVADGHFHTGIKIAAVCVIGGPFADSDGDGYCDPEEAALGSNPASAASTPENLAIPTSCSTASDGNDNDGDGATDIADTGCQRPLHDLRMIVDEAARSVNDPRNDCKSTNSDAFHGLYKIKIEELLVNQTQQPWQFGIIIDPIPGGGGVVAQSATGPGTKVVEVKDAGVPGVTANGPINIDGDNDVEWLALVTRTESKTLEVKVRFANLGCVPGAPRAPADGGDYRITVDVCHGGDPSPLGLAMLAQTTLRQLAPDCAGAAPGEQDRENNAGESCPDPGKDCGPSNDAPTTIIVDDRSG